MSEATVSRLQRTVAVSAPGDFSAVCQILRDNKLREHALDRTGELGLSLMGNYPTIGGVRVSEGDLLRLRENLERRFVRTDGERSKPIKSGNIDAGLATLNVASENPYHPVSEWLSKLRWDKQDRVPALCEALGCEPTTLHLSILRCFLVMAATRGLTPGAKADNVLVLVGAQGARKSSALRELFSSEWFSDSEVRPGSKDSYMVAATTWCLEWAELASMRSARDVETVKAFLTATHDQFRPPYGRDVIRQARTAVIVATTNDEEFLSDPTGNRRFWPLRVGEAINLPLIKLERVQLWAQAAELAAKGARYWLTPGEEAELRILHKTFEPRDTWQDLLEGWLACDQARVTDVTTANLLEKAIGKPAGQWTRSDEMRVARAMRSLGYAKQRVQSGNGDVRPRVWVHTVHTVHTSMSEVGRENHNKIE